MSIYDIRPDIWEYVLIGFSIIFKLIVSQYDLLQRILKVFMSQFLCMLLFFNFWFALVLILVLILVFYNYVPFLLFDFSYWGNTICV